MPFSRDSPAPTSPGAEWGHAQGTSVTPVPSPGPHSGRRRALEVLLLQQGVWRGVGCSRTGQGLATPEAGKQGGGGSWVGGCSPGTASPPTAAPPPGRHGRVAGRGARVRGLRPGPRPTHGRPSARSPGHCGRVAPQSPRCTPSAVGAVPALPCRLTRSDP